MLLGKDVIGNPIIHKETGQQIGRVKDLFIDKGLNIVTGIYAGSEGIFNPTPRWIAATDVAVISSDAVLVERDGMVTEGISDQMGWLRRDDLQGRSVDTKGGTKVGRVGDIILDSGAHIIGFALDRVFVRGPIAKRRALRRTAVQDTGHEDGSMTINLEEAEQQDLRVVNKTFFTEEVALTGTEGPRKSPYADTPPNEAYASHEDISPYIAGEEQTEDDTYRSPYTTPEPTTEEEARAKEEQPFKSPYATPENTGS